VAAAAHDIRSPLTAMKGFGYALSRRWNEMSVEQRSMMLEGIIHDADRMDTILRMLVDAARVMSGTLEAFREHVDVGDLVLGVAEAQRRDPDHPPVEWVGEVAGAFVDPARLRTTLLAFCESLVWWGSGGPIVIDGRSDGRTLHLEASRQATGLSTDDVEALFRPRRPGEGAGTKIGLFVAREVGEGRLTLQLELPITTDASTTPAEGRPVDSGP
jgi:signal transduction histidine kinase